MKRKEELVPIEYVCFELQISTQTLNVWYRWKQREPEQYENFGHELPDYIQEGNRQKRYWHKSDIPKIAKFRDAIPKGRNGILGNITQVGARKKQEEKVNAKKSSERSKAKRSSDGSKRPRKNG